MSNLTRINSAAPAATVGPLPTLTVTVSEALRISGYSRSELYRRLASGDIEGVKIGRSLRIVVESIYRSVAALPRAQFAQPKAA